MDERRYFVYILMNPRNTVLYTGMTGDLASRIDSRGMIFPIN